MTYAKIMTKCYLLGTGTFVTLLHAIGRAAKVIVFAGAIALAGCVAVGLHVAVDKMSATVNHGQPRYESMPLTFDQCPEAR